MEQFKFFNAKKMDVITSLNSLKILVSKLNEVGLDVSEDVSKIEKSIKDIEEDALRIALLGAFSDGKTSVVAGWLGQIMDNMKIDTDESSDRLAIYRPQNQSEKFEIVDTPGLFGDKSRNDDNDNEIQYSDITKKYLSEAHLIFYVVDATNPLKDSHKETVQWVLRDLNKLSSTIFIINKMDEVADLRDTEDFNNQAKIKKENLLGKLQRFVNLSDEEKKNINVVCISSNPNNRGLDFWLEKKEMYEDRSRINSLKQTTHSILDRTTRDVLIKKTGFDVIQDIVGKKINEAESEFIELALYSNKMISEINRVEEDISRGKLDVISAKKDLLKELLDAEKRLLGHIRTLAREEIVSFLEDEIGLLNNEVGYKLNLLIEQSCERCFQQSSNIMKGIGASIEKQLESTESFMNSISSSALSASSKALGAVSKLPLGTIKSGVFAARDAIGSLTGTFIKFKPWQATKIAANISKWAGPVGAGIQVVTDVVSMAQKQKEEEELVEIQKDIADLVKGQFKVIYDILADNTKVFEKFSPQIVVFEGILQQQRDSFTDIQHKKTLLESIKGEFRKAAQENKIVDAEFTVL